MKANRLKSRLLFAIVSTHLLINVDAFHSSSLQWKEYSMISTISRTNRLLRFGSPATTNRARSCCASFLSMNPKRLNDDDTGDTQTNANFKANSGAQFNIASLINSSISRASSTLSSKSASPIDTDLQSNETRDRDEYEDKDGVVEATIVEQTTKKEEPPVPSPEQNRESKSTKEQRSYLDNPAVTPTALAHSLWLEVIRPDDTIIDATAGNGKDSLTLSKLLFSPSNSLNSLDADIDVDGTNDKIPATGAQLISIDIQKSACDNTISLLRENLDPEILENSVQVMHQSHAPMPSLPKESVGLICYNLGYLPGTSQEVKKAYTTQMMTTLYSLADSALLIRRGGLLSVMSYPGNGWKEHCAVSYFMEGMAMYTARDKDAWIKFVDAIPTDYKLEQDHMVLYKDSIVTVVDEDAITVRETVRMALDRVKQNGFENQTWRVFDHRPLGRPLSPILFSGMRIK